MGTPELEHAANTSDVNLPESISQSNYLGFSINGDSNFDQEFMREYQTLSDGERRLFPLLNTVLDFRHLSKLYIRYLERYLLDSEKLIYQSNSEGVIPGQIIQVGRFLHMHGKAIHQL